MTGLVFFAGVFAYTFIGTLVAHRLDDSVSHSFDAPFEHPLVVLGAIFWPVAVLLGTPISLGNRVARQLKQRADQKALPPARVVKK
jgi:hypothetical protein